MTNHALIIGGGIAGTVTAIALRDAGMDATVFEAYDRTADGVGAYLSLAVNGIAALRALDLHKLVREHGFATPRIAFVNGTGRRLGEIPQGGELADGTVCQTLRRGDLYRSLREEALRRGVRVEYGKRLAGAERTAHGVRAEFADGSAAEGDLLIGADGLHSRTRTVIDPRAPEPRYLGLLNTGGYAHGLPELAPPGSCTMMFGKRCFFAHFQHPNGQVWWFANPPAAEEPGRAELAAITPERWKARLIALFAEDAGPAVDIIKATPEVIPPWPTHDLPSVPTWHTDRMVIIGDAAHAASPSSGQGASMACEDAVTLGKCLHDLPDVPAAFAEFERLRRDRVERVVAQGKRNGDQKAVGPVGRVLRDLALPLVLHRMDRATNRPDAWIHQHRIDWATPVTAPAAPGTPVPGT
ncbi:FAD-dependent monooxygenase [Pseudonocardia eucalypti]|uniref:FAD-dependent monooxygenase n=1 Tax=Pseudonocardia eucalypti TaxID=648755 RepID=A0ABP9QSE1_9PSEU|nr:2-polyprenyl-6-methoxyphenol hydroxylase-like FAD-dependent oxidoreductase [Pseudonocardia eucalypti]